MGLLLQFHICEKQTCRTLLICFHFGQVEITDIQGFRKARADPLPDSDVPGAQPRGGGVNP